MNAAPVWTTSSDGDAADTRPDELAVLRAHVQQCTASSGRLAALRCGALQLQDFLVTHLVTTAAVLAVLLLGGAALLQG